MRDEILIDEINCDIGSVEAQLTDIEWELEHFEIDPADVEEQFEEFMDEMYTEGNPFFERFCMRPSEIIQNCDPITWRCGLNDYVDSLDLQDDPRYRELEDEQHIFQVRLNSLHEQLEELEREK